MTPFFVGPNGICVQNEAAGASYNFMVYKFRNLRAFKFFESISEKMFSTLNSFSIDINWIENTI